MNLVGEKRFKELRNLMNQGKIDLRTLAKNASYSGSDKRVLFLVEEMAELQKR